MIVVTVPQIEYVAFHLARGLFTYNEPIPDFATRFPNILESCLGSPFQTFGRKELYPTLIAKSSILFYMLIKNHPFQNGNKRIAVTTLLYVLYREKKWLNVETRALYNCAMFIAKSPTGAKDEMVSYIEKFINNNIEALKPMAPKAKK